MEMSLPSAHRDRALGLTVDRVNLFRREVTVDRQLIKVVVQAAGIRITQDDVVASGRAAAWLRCRCARRAYGGVSTGPSRTDLQRCRRSAARPDQKAGLAIGFAGVLVTLRHDISEPWRALGVVASVISAGLALSSFWPRRYEVLDNVRDYLAAPEPQTQLVLVDTLALMNLRTDRSMGAKEKGGHPNGEQRG
jgi:hypothetical protein